MDKKTLKRLAETLKNFPLEENIYIMEVCGTHTVEFFRTGVRSLFPKHLHLIDGPGCPVCVTPNEYLDRAIEIGKQYHPIIATFGDMMKVPSSYSSLKEEKAKGMDITVVYSPFDAVEIAAKNPDREVMFVNIGFETTAPGEAQAILEAKERGIKNFSILCGNKLTVPAVEALLQLGETKIDGFILPGHVSTVIGAAPWKDIPQKYHKPSVVAGFETGDLLMGTLMLLELITEGKNDVLLNEYTRAVKENGNPKAIEAMYTVFDVCDANWRGIGIIPGSGLCLREEFADFDAERKFPVTPPPSKEPKGCRCGDILRGMALPPDCPLFGRACRPERPVGPCMVSAEGACAAYYIYGGYSKEHSK